MWICKYCKAENKAEDIICQNCKKPDVIDPPMSYEEFKEYLKTLQDCIFFTDGEDTDEPED